MEISVASGSTTSPKPAPATDADKFISAPAKRRRRHISPQKEEASQISNRFAAQEYEEPLDEDVAPTEQQR